MNVAMTAIGKGEPSNHRAAPTAQKQEHNQNRQQCAFNDRYLHVVHCAFDEVGRRAQQLQFCARRQQLANISGGNFQAVANLHDIGILRLEDIEADRRNPVDASDRIALALGIEYFGNLRQQDRRPTFARHDDLAKIGGLFDAAVDADYGFDRVVADRADRNADVCVAQSGHDLIDGQAERGQSARVDPHLDLARHGSCQAKPCRRH